MIINKDSQNSVKLQIYMIFSITINPSRQNSTAIRKAYRFIMQAQKKGCTVSMVYFYGYAVAELQDLKQANIENWRDLSANCKLQYCSSISESLGLEKGLPDCFESSTLSQWLLGIENTDRHLEFI